MAYIYKITNDFDEKIYIGKTTRSIDIRFLEHFTQGNKRNSYIDNSMAIHGIEHFQCEILEKCSIEQINERERYWIAFFHSYIKDPLCNGKGYNLTPGGDGKTLTDIQISAIRTLWEQGKSIKEISEELKLSHSTVYHRVCKYTDFNIRENQKRAKKDQYKSIDLYNKEGKFIKNYDSLASAAKDLNILTSEISVGIKNHYLVHNYRFAYKDEKLIIPPSNKKIVMQFDTQGKYIQSFDSARAASRELKMDSAGIIKTCNGQQRTSKNFIFIYEQDFSEELLKDKVEKAREAERYRKK